MMFEQIHKFSSSSSADVGASDSVRDAVTDDVYINPQPSTSRDPDVNLVQQFDPLAADDRDSDDDEVEDVVETVVSEEVGAEDEDKQQCMRGILKSMFLTSLTGQKEESWSHTLIWILRTG